MAGSAAQITRVDHTIGTTTPSAFMALLSLRNVSLAFGGPRLLDQVELQIEQGERVCLLGRNGEGKSTLLRLIQGEIEPDEGQVIRQQGLRIARLPQDVPRDQTGTVADQVAHGLEDTGHPATRSDHRVLTVLSRMDLDPDAHFEDLSSGMKRRVLLAQSLVGEPDILLLDEPTNHLDIDAIRWLEAFLPRAGGTLVFVTHDRVFLEQLATRIVELDRGQLYDWACDYPTFLKRREEVLHAEARQQELFDKKLAQEEVWIRKGIEARRTRNEGRVRALKAMREQRAKRRERQGTARITTQEAERSGALVDRGQRGELRLWRRPGDPGPDDDHHARRQGGHHRPQRLGQDDPDSALARRDSRREPERSASAHGSRSPTSIS